MRNSYKPLKPEVFWCNACDHRQVDSEDSTTGSFHLRFGHSFNKESGLYDGEYVGVMFAVCNECKESEE